MAEKIKVWFDAEGDYLEVQFNDAAGYMKETKHEAVMERVDAQGKIIESDPHTAEEVIDLWTFERDTTSPDPNWILVETRTPD